jgi:hypothetical protein
MTRRNSQGFLERRNSKNVLEVAVEKEITDKDGVSPPSASYVNVTKCTIWKSKEAVYRQLAEERAKLTFVVPGVGT